MAVIVVTGTPGTGKTTVSQRLAKMLGFVYIDVNKVISARHLSSGYDRKRRCKIIDTQSLNKELIKIIKKHGSVIIDSHLAHLLPKKAVDLCIITRCNLKLLGRRLKRRGYSSSKVSENLEVEIMEVIPDEVHRKGHRFIFVDTDKKPDYPALVKKIKRFV